jgi:hypothetical protein
MNHYKGLRPRKEFGDTECRASAGRGTSGFDKGNPSTSTGKAPVKSEQTATDYARGNKITLLLDKRKRLEDTPSPPHPPRKKSPEKQTAETIAKPLPLRNEEKETPSPPHSPEKRKREEEGTPSPLHSPTKEEG